MIRLLPLLFLLSGCAPFTREDKLLLCIGFCWVTKAVISTKEKEAEAPSSPSVPAGPTPEVPYQAPPL